LEAAQDSRVQLGVRSGHRGGVAGTPLRRIPRVFAALVTLQKGNSERRTNYLEKWKNRSLGIAWELTDYFLGNTNRR
jgi:hypothetical protein